ncbi:MAG: GAF domain-containing protein [Chloroflexota bacterium]
MKTENTMYKDQVEHNEARFRILTEASQQITSTLDITELLERVVRLIQRAFGYYHVGIGLVEGDEVVYRVGAGALWDDPNFQFRPQRLRVGVEGITGWVASTREAALVPDVMRDPRYVWMQGSQTRSELTVPITVKGRAIGVLDIQSDHPNNFSAGDLEFMQLLANQAGVAIENARLFAETQRHLKETEKRAQKLAIINSLQQGLASKLDVQSIYELVGEKFRDIFGAQVVMVSSYDSKADTVEHCYCIERGRRVIATGARPPGGFREQVIRTRQPLLVNTNVAGEAAQRGQPVLPDTDAPKSWLGAPMLVGDQVTGILSVQNLDEENAFDETDTRFLQMFAASISIALENARLYEQAQRLAVLEERQRLARELHDSVTQSLYGINLYAEAASGQLALGQNEQALQYLNDIQTTAQESLSEMRLLIYELRPPILEREGLTAALQNRLYAVEQRAGLKFDLQDNLAERLPSVFEDGLYRIAHEALNNTLKHSRAKHLAIHIRQEEERVIMEITDDGIGFEPGAAHREGCLGLVSMRERAQALGGRVSVESGPGNGTRIRVEVRR